MVYIPGNPSTGFNGHFSLVTPPSAVTTVHQDSPSGGAEATNSSSPSAAGNAAVQDGWQASAWVTQHQQPCSNLIDNQHYTISSSGFASQTDAEMALAASGKTSSLTSIQHLKILLFSRCQSRVQAHRFGTQTHALFATSA